VRVHSLAVTGFGPFADTVRVDLDALSQDGLFLLCGPTGAGKTSLLDAIAFALYGRVPGARGQEKRLRSDHARAGVRTEVVCELTLRGERVRVTRRPEQIRPKARGTGTTKDQALLHVQRQVAGAWEPVSIRLDEGSDYLHGQVGLSAEQFWQVVLLPQGEFAEFLRAEPDQRAKVLETLFDSGRFADVETWLADHARSLATSQHSADQVVDRLVHRVEQAVRGLPSTEPGTEPGAETDLESGADLLAMPADQDPDLIRHYLVRQLSRARAQLELAGNEDEATLARLGAAETARDRGRQAVRAVERLLDVHRQADFLQLRSDDLVEQRVRLAAALAAEPLRPFLDAEAEAATRCCETADALADSYADLLGSDPDELRPVRLRPLDHCASGGGGSVRARSGSARSAAKCSAGVGSADPVSAPEELELVSVSVSGSVTAGPELRRWARILRAEVTRLADLESDQAVVDTDERRMAELVQAQTGRQASLDELVEISNRLPTALAALEARRDAARVDAAGVEHAAGALRSARVRVEAATRAKGLTKLIRIAEADEVEAQRSALQAKADWLVLRETRLAGIAAELAGQLADGQGCPVCGSAEHPAPAEQAESAVTAADERAAAQRHEALEEAGRSAAARLIELRGEFDVCCSVTSGASASAIGKELTTAIEADALAREAAQQLPTLIREHSDLVNGQDELRAQLSALGQAQTEDRLATQALHATLARNRRRLDLARGHDASLTARRERLIALAEAADAVELAWSAHTSALAAAASARTRLGDRLRRSDFDTPDAAAAAFLDDDSRQALDSAIRDHDDERTGVTADLVSATEAFGAAWTELSLPWPSGLGSSRTLQTRDVDKLVQRVRDTRDRLDHQQRDAVQARDQAVAALSRARGISSQLEELQVLLDQALAECEPLRAASDQAASLAALTVGGGANTMKMRLRSYVLAARLEQVAAAATARLRQMSSGRYGFVHSDDLRGGNRRSGLSVDILDSYTGTQRPTKTLSGGESFMAALALALGLADVVTAESGGIALDTLFVDEGFGSLDPESLDAVMTVLDELRQGGRVVGIVSHVEELRTRVPMQLQIRTSSHGSTLDQNTMPAGPGAVRLAG